MNNLNVVRDEGSTEPLCLDYFRVILVRGDEEQKWNVVANPKWNPFTRALSNILQNHCNGYSEYGNCGVVYRMIRADDWLEYASGELHPAWALDPALA